MTNLDVSWRRDYNASHHQKQQGGALPQRALGTGWRETQDGGHLVSWGEFLRGSPRLLGFVFRDEPRTDLHVIAEEAQGRARHDNLQRRLAQGPAIHDNRRSCRVGLNTDRHLANDRQRFLGRRLIWCDGRRSRGCGRWSVSASASGARPYRGSERRISTASCARSGAPGQPDR